MAGKKENIKALFSNSRSRIIILFTVILLVITVVVGVIKFSGASSGHADAETNVAVVGGIQSIPGAVNQTAQYAALQATQNIEQAKKARETGGSAIPTIIRTHAFGEGVEVIGQKEGEGGADFSALTNDNSGEGGPTHAWVETLKNGHCSKASIDTVISQGGAINDLKTSCSCGQLKIAGYKVKDLEPVCSCAELKAANFDIVQLKEGGFTAGRLRLCGYTACDTKGVGFSAQEMKDAGFSDGELKGAGFSEQDIARAGGLPDGITISDVQKAQCDPAALARLHASGVTAAAVRRINGCSADKLKAAGFTARELKNAGFSAAEMKNAGFSAAELQAANFGARDLLNAGFTSDDLVNAGFSTAEIKAAEMVLPFGLTPADVKKAGCSVEAIKRQRLAGVSATAIHNHAGCTVDALSRAGFNKNDLINAGFTPAEISAAAPVIDNSTIREAGCDPEKLKILRAQGVSAGRIHGLNGCSIEALKQAGFDATSLLDAGFSPVDLQTAGFTAAEISAAESAQPVSSDAIRAAGCDPDKLKVLMAQGASAGRIHGLNGCNAAVLKQAGFDAKSLINAGFKAEDLINAGFTAAELSAAGSSEANNAVSNDAIQRAGCDPEKLKELMAQGVSAGRIHGLNGCSVEALKQAGFDAKALMDAGFSPEDLQKAGFTAAEISAAESAQPVSSDAIRAAGCDPDKLKVLMAQGATAGRIHGLNGCSADVLKQAGFDGKSLINAGFTPAELLKAGVTAGGPSEAVSNDVVHSSGCDPEKLKTLMAQGVTADRIHKLNGCSADILKQAGYDVKSLADAGFTPEELLAAGFTPGQLIEAGLSPTGVIAAGRAADCSAKSLTAAHQLGVSAATIKQTLGCNANALNNAGFSAVDLKNAGFTAAELKNAGFTLSDLKNVGYSAKALAGAGWTAKQLKDAGFNARQLKEAGFSAQELKDTGFSATDLKNAGFSAADLKNAGYSIQELKNANFNAADLKQAGFNAAQLKAAGYSAAALKEAGFNADMLRAAGFSASDLKKAGFSNEQIKQAGFSKDELRNGGFSLLAGLDTIAPLPTAASNIPAFGTPAATGAAAIAESNAKRIEEMRSQQEKQAAVQRYQQKIQDRGGAMLSAANQLVQEFKIAPQQVYMAGSDKEEGKKEGSLHASNDLQTGSTKGTVVESENKSTGAVVIKTGDILFAVIDTSVNTDEPGPILATIVSGKLQGSKLIGSFNLPGQADKMIVTFNTLSIPGADTTVSVTAFAIDPNTARTALSSETDHHYLARYGALFASTFIEGFGNAFQASGTTITIGGTGGTTNTTVQNGVGRSTLDNAVIGLATLGKAWGQDAAKNLSRPTTVQLYAGTGVGVLFTQDLKLN